MKKLLALLLSFGFISSCTGCSDTRSEPVVSEASYDTDFEIEYPKLEKLGDYDILIGFGTGYMFQKSSGGIEGLECYLRNSNLERCRLMDIIRGSKEYVDSSGAHFYSNANLSMYGICLIDCTDRYDLVSDSLGNPIEYAGKNDNVTYYECDFGVFSYK